MNLSRSVWCPLLGFFLAVSFVTAQIPRSSIYSRPALPSTEALSRLNLKLAWRAYVPMDGRRDSILSIELIDRDIFVLTRSGEVIRLDQETGEQKWRVSVGKPYTLAPSMSANSRSVYVVSNAKLFGIDRARGTRKWDHTLLAGISAPPAADEVQVYLPGANGRLAAFYLPQTDAVEGGSGLQGSRVYTRQDKSDEIRPRPNWVEETNITMLFRPLVTTNNLFIISPEGKGIGYSKVLREGARSTEIFSFSTGGKLLAPPGHFGDFAYIGSEDATLYSVNLENGKLRWRHTTGTGVTRTPVALENDVYVTSQHEGMARLDRESGDPMWRINRGSDVGPANPDADRFLAANERFVYANDYSGRLLVLDRKRGTKLSMLDTSAFRVPVVNALTDRIYLAANDGLIICMHDRDQIKPIRHQLALEKEVSSVQKKLEQKVTVSSIRGAPLINVLDDLRKNFGLNFVITEDAFKEAGKPDVKKTPINFERDENRPLKEILKRILDQAAATYQVVDQSILIVPQPPKAEK